MQKQDLQKRLVDACYYGESDKVIQLLRSGANPDAPDNRGYFPLHFACQEGWLDVLKTLIKSGGHVNIPDREGSLPLFSAVGAKHLSVIRYLLRNGCDVNARRPPPSDDTPLLLACAFGDLNITSILVKAGADIEGTDRRSRTPIFFAVMGGHANATSFLIKMGANLNRKCRNGKTLLDIARKNRDEKTIWLLAAALKRRQPIKCKGVSPDSHRH